LYGVQNIASQIMQARTMMRLRGSKLDSSKFIATGTGFSDFEALLSDGASLHSRHRVRVRESLKHRSNLLRCKYEALTIRPSGPANTPLRSVPVVH
jgi:hypothetical protein